MVDLVHLIPALTAAHLVGAVTVSVLSSVLLILRIRRTRRRGDSD